jgi:hypothetical protein
MEEIADSLRPIADEIPDLQVYAYWNDNPSPPALDVYPATPFQLGAGFGIGDVQVYLTVRARVVLGDPESAQQLLLRLLDPGDPASVEAALTDVAVIPSDREVGGFRQYGDDSAEARMLGCDWTVSAFLGVGE